MAAILIVDDDATLCSMLARRIESAGHAAACANTIEEGFNSAHTGNFDVVLLDVVLPDGNGLDHIVRFTSVPSTPEIIVMTGAGDSNGAESAIKSGAWSYLVKPHVIRDLLLSLTRALDFRLEKQTVQAIRVSLKREKIIGSSSPIVACLDLLAVASTSMASVLITGETGTGKEVFARTLHENSPRANKPFIIVDCAALADTLIESTLFGHTKGAFTGAANAQQGLIQAADGGTLFLDEVGELPLDVQKKFLRVLQEGSYRQVGSIREAFSDFRLITATNRNIEQMSKDGQFRADLLFRLRSFHLHLPPLRDRLEDIPELTRQLTSEICSRFQIEPKRIATDFLEYLSCYHWPGNIRELQNLLEEVCAQARNHHTLFSYHLPQYIRIYQAQRMLEKIVSAPGAGYPDRRVTSDQSLATSITRPVLWKEYKRNMEREYIANLMAYVSGNIAEAVAISGLSRARIYQLLNKS